MKATDEEDLIWIEHVLLKSPIDYRAIMLFMVYILYIIFYFLTAHTELKFFYMESNPLMLIKMLATISIIPIEIISIMFCLNNSKKIFSYLDNIFIRSESKFYPLFKERVQNSRKEFIFILIFLGLPLAFLSINRIASEFLIFFHWIILVILNCSLPCFISFFA
jgi:hypothetical protein